MERIDGNKVISHKMAQDFLCFGVGGGVSDGGGVGGGVSGGGDGDGVSDGKILRS